MVILALASLPLACRFIDSPPELPAKNAAWIRASATLGHVAQYALLFALPALGILFSWANGHPVSLFGLIEIPSPMR